MSGKKFINIGVGVDTEPLKKGMQDAARITATESNKIATAATAGGDAIAASNQKSTKSLETYSQQMRVAQKEAQQLAVKYGLTNNATQEAIKKTQAARDNLYRFNAEISKSSTVATTAVSGYNPLSNSINQLTREMPAFTYSMQTGFMALSNNIPIFVDNINSIKAANAGLIAQGQPVKSVFSQVAAALLSWNTVLSLGITLVTVFGKEISDFISGNKNAAISSENAAKAQEEYNAKMREGIELINKINPERIKEWENLNKLNQMREGGINQLEREKKLQEAIAASSTNDRDKGQAAIAAFNIGQKIRELELLELKKTLVTLEVYGNERLEIQKNIYDKENEMAIAALQNPRSKPINTSQAIQIESRASVDLGSASKQVNDKLQAEYKKLNLKLDPLIKVSPQVILDYSWAAILKKRMEAALASINAAIQSGIGTFISQTAAALGSGMVAIAEGDYKNPFDALGHILLQSLGGLMSTLGAQFVALGFGMLKMQASLATLNPVGVIASGVALVAAGAAISTIASKGMQRNQSSSGGGAPSGGGFTPTNNPTPNYGNNNGGQLSTKLDGYTLNFVIDNQQRISRR